MKEVYEECCTKEEALKELYEREHERNKFKETGNIFKTHEVEGFNTKLLTVGLVIKVRLNGYCVSTPYIDRIYFIKDRDIDKLDLINYSGNVITVHKEEFDKNRKSYYEILEILN